jgi:hypothetical protein
MNGKEELLVLWTSKDKTTAINMVFMYAENSKIKGWWKDITLLIWGASAKLVSDDKEIRYSIKSLQQVDVKIIACKQCAEQLNIVEVLENIGIEVFYTGEFITNWIKSNKKIITI